MRWEKKIFVPLRIRSGFLFKPREIKGENRWLERATWLEEFICWRSGASWEALMWIDDEADMQHAQNRIQAETERRTYGKPRPAPREH